MLIWLRRILLMTVVVAAIFLVVWYMRFPPRLAEGTLELGTDHLI